jgi:hypothetical protein
MTTQSEVMKLRWQDPVFREAMRKKSKDNWDKGIIRVSRKGSKISEESKKKMSESRKKYFKNMDMDTYKKYHIGKKQSEETKQKHSIISKKMWSDKEWAEAMRNKLAIYGQTPESNKKRSIALQGRKKSPEHNKKVSESIKKWWSNPENRKRMTGDNAFYWKGGVTPLKKLIRHCSKYKEWRISIMERDNYTCQKCDKHGGWLEVDHYPKTFAEILYEYNIKTLEDALNCEELWNKNNGRTLCKKCHKKHQKK